MLVLPGSAALSPARLERTIERLRPLGVTAAAARFVHVVDDGAPLTPDELAALRELLSYGPRAALGDLGGADPRFFVVPRLGTVSPWSSKATDIVHTAGLAKVRRRNSSMASSSIPKTQRRVVLANRPAGEPSGQDFRVEEVPVPEPGPGQILVRAIYLSLDPYMRGRMRDVVSYAPVVQIGEVMPGGIVDSAPLLGGQAVGSMVGTFCGLFSNGKKPYQVTYGIAEDLLRDLGASGDLHDLVGRRNTVIVQYRVSAVQRWFAAKEKAGVRY